MAFIKEIILENFMSYSYARIPLKRGLNLICGPNGAGKSSILLALSVALGQSHTERSRKLSDLVRRGEEMGRVSVVFDNSPEDEGRPIPYVETDDFVISRYLKRDGTYWHEANYETVTKSEVNRLLSQLSINPDNMLIIMHQHMIDEFGAIDAQERLKMVEEAVGLREYREKILKAREKLSHTLSEEESINAMLEKASDTLAHWEEEYQRYLEKTELMEKRERLEREYAWSKWDRQRRKVDDLYEKLTGIKTDLNEIAKDLERVEMREEESKLSSDKLEYEIENAYQGLIQHERDRSDARTRLKIIDKLEELPEDSYPESIGSLLGERKTIERKIELTDTRIEEAKTTLVAHKKDLRKKRQKYVDHRVRKAILAFRRELLEKEASSLKSDLRGTERELEELKVEAEDKGSKLVTGRNPREILDDIRITNAQLSGLADVSSDVEKMYKGYKELLEELKKKAEEAARNRRRAIEELELRKGIWKENLRELIQKVRETYREILGRADGLGDVRLVNLEDIDEAGLGLLVGFRGTEPRTLDSYTQSGGERTTAIMCFLLALQQHIKSPVRGLDEFDVHMDPQNRQTILKQLLKMMGGADEQYLVITPGQLVEVEGASNVIAAQNVGGSSQIKVTA